MEEYRNLSCRIDGAVGRIIMHRKPTNIIDFEMMSELSLALDQLKDAAVLILTTSLEHFSTGVDVRIHTPALAPKMLKDFHGVIRKIYHHSGATICALRGYALGGGLELAIVCDLIAAEKDTKLGFPEIRLAAFPPVASVFLPRIIGRIANRLLFTGDQITAIEAKEMGLVDEIGSVDAIEARLTSGSFDAIRRLKETLHATAAVEFDSELEKAEKIYLEKLLASPDVSEGVEAFLEKRQAKYGRS